MAGITNTLLIECRMARLNQEKFAIEALALAVYLVRPDLTEQIAMAGDTTLARLGIPRVAGSSHPAISNGIESVVRASGEAMGMAPEAVPAGVAAAFARAVEARLDVETVASYLCAPVARSTR
jgi:hypothetical protein